MADPGGGAQHDRLLQFAGQTKGLAGHFLGFLSRNGLKTGQRGETGVMAVVLLVLAGMAAGVVGREHHQTAGQADIGRGKQGIGGHVEAHMLHGHQAHGAAQGTAGGHFHGDLLVNGVFQPVAALTAQAEEGVGHFRGRRARITGNHVHARFQSAAHDSFIAQ